MLKNPDPKIFFVCGHYIFHTITYKLFSTCGKNILNAFCVGIMDKILYLY